VFISASIEGVFTFFPRYGSKRGVADAMSPASGRSATGSATGGARGTAGTASGDTGRSQSGTAYPANAITTAGLLLALTCSATGTGARDSSGTATPASGRN
jgi:hypothetical protein